MAKGGGDMYKSSEDPLKSSFTITDMFYVGIFVDERQEIMPIEVNFEDIFYDLIEVRSFEAIHRNSELVLNMYNEEVMYNISGSVIRTSKDNGLYRTTIKIETLPTKLFNELISMMKEMVGEINQK